MRRSAFRTQAVALGILIVASVVGNVSLSTSRAHATPSPAPELLAAPTSPVARDTGRASAQPSDDMAIVPAIYSWDPDVRFVFYRHVAKWM